MATEGDDERVVMVNIYDTHASNANFKVKPNTTAAEICKIILSKRDILSSESRFFSIVLVVTAFNAVKKIETHCLRTLKPNEFLLETKKTIVAKIMSKCSITDESKLESADKWYFKDMRTNPIELGATSDICGEYSSDEDEEISPSDLSYLAKSERKGYLLKRSNTDFNLWRRWYCVLMDQLWCVDISRESPRAKCVRLSGMIRYREGYKTLDQLQIIIINSSDGKSHFFRAFNLIDQKKWIQDLNIKTRVAADNDSFAMAEMIITDEVDARSFRLVKQVGEVLDRTKTMEAIAFHRAVELNNATAGNIADDCPPSSSLAAYRDFTPISRANSMRPESAPKPNINFMLDTVVAKPEESTEDASEASAAAVGTAAGRSLGLAECTRLTHPRCCSGLYLHNLQMCDRLEGHYLLHELHKDSRLVTDIMLFVIDVQCFRECLRRELYVPVPKQQQAAKNLYLKHILPQLLLANLDGYPDFNHEMMQLGGSTSTNSVASGKLVSPSSPSRLTSLSGKGGFSPSSKMRNEYSSRVRNRSSTAGATTSKESATDGVSGPKMIQPAVSAEPAATSAFAAIDWRVDVAVLMRIHSALFAMHQRAVEVQNGYVTNDPLQLVKYAAGTSKFRARDRSISTAPATPAVGGGGGLPPALPSAAPLSTSPATSSFWPWFSTSFSSTPAPGSTANSASSSPVPSRKGSDAAALAASTPLVPPPTSAAAAEAVTVAPGPSNDSTAEDLTAVGTEGMGIAGAASSDSAKILTLEKPNGSSSTDAAVASVNSPSSPVGDSGGNKAPSAELFDEVVGVLLLKLS